MKIKLTITCLLLFFLFYQQSKAQAFENGTNVLSVGLGLGTAIGSGYSTSSSTPAFSAQFEHGQWSVGGPGVISLGGYLGYVSRSYNSGAYYYSSIGNYTYTEKWNYTVIGVRSAYHYNGIQNKDFDVYGGAMISYDILSYKFTSSNPQFDYLYNQSYSGGIQLSLYVGGRYFFTNNVAVFAELGYGVSYFTIGAAFKL